MDDIGLETDSSIALMETTYGETPEAAEPFAPKDAPIQRFIALLVESGFSGEQLRKLDNAMNSAGVCLVPVGSMKSVAQ